MELLKMMSLKPELDGEPHGGISRAVLCLLPVAALTSLAYLCASSECVMRCILSRCLDSVQHYSCETHLCCANGCRWFVLLAITVCMDPNVFIHAGASGLSQALLNSGALSVVIHVLWGTYVHILM